MARHHHIVHVSWETDRYPATEHALHQLVTDKVSEIENEIERHVFHGIEPLVTGRCDNGPAGSPSEEG